MPRPQPATQRIISLDVLRGFALLGILIMNIQSFSMIGAAYLNPTAYGDFTGANKMVWILSHVCADYKFMTLFSMLFGAGVVLFTDRLVKKGVKSLTLHYRRMFWLLLFGLCHAYLLWMGDILVAYAVSGFWVVLLRRKTPKVLLITGIVLFSIGSLISVMGGMSMPYMDAAAKQELTTVFAPAVESVQHELETYRSGWLTQMKLRVSDAFEMQTFLFLILFGWRIGGIMLMGMALYKWGVLSAKRTSRFYAVMISAGFSLGFSLILLGLHNNFNAGFSADYSFFFGAQFNYWGSLFVAFGYIGVIMLWVRRLGSSFLSKAFQAIGKTALTNYLLQSIICTFIFYGHGLGLFGYVARWQQMGIVVAVWVVQILVSVFWLKHYRYGPFEWLWRSLTYWKWQAIMAKR